MGLLSVYAGLHDHGSAVRKTLGYLWPPQNLRDRDDTLSNRLRDKRTRKQHDTADLRARPAGTWRRRNPATGVHPDRRDVQFKTARQNAGIFTGVWGFSSIVGPLLGGFLVDQLSWRWVFYINLPPGLLAAALVALAWREQSQSHERPKVDYFGAALLTSSAVSLLLGLMEFGTFNSWVLIALAAALFIALVWVGDPPRRRPDPAALNFFATACSPQP